MPEYQNMSRIERSAMRQPSHLHFLASETDPAFRYKPALGNWCRGKALSAAGVEFISLFLEYSPTLRMNAKEGLNHKWFLEEPLPTAKSVIISLKPSTRPSLCL